MSSLAVKNLQVGVSPKSSENFHLTSDGAGSLSLNRGTTGAAISTVLSVDSSNNVTINNDFTNLTGNFKVATPLSSELTKAATTAYTKAQAEALYSYKKVLGIQSAATNGNLGTALAFDSSGNLYWAVTNYFNGTANTALTSYVYKITPAGQLSTFTSVSLTGATGTALAFDSSGNLYWAVALYTNGSGTWAYTSNVYKITPAGTQTTFASQATTGATSTALAFDNSGNLYWAITNNYNGSTYNLTSNVYQITPAGTKTTFGTASTIAGAGTALAFDSSGNLYWAVINGGTAGSYSQLSYIYKITSAGTQTTFTSITSIGGAGTALIFDSSGNLFWAVINNYNGSTTALTSYVYKVLANATTSVFASFQTSNGNNVSIDKDSSNTLYLAVTNNVVANVGATNLLYKLTSTGTISILAAQSLAGSKAAAVKFDNVGNLYWSNTAYNDGSTFNKTSYLNCLYKTQVK
jgi:hypothetical protein